MTSPSITLATLAACLTAHALTARAQDPPPAEPAPAPPAMPAEPAFAPWPTARLALELEVYTQARWTRRTGDDLTELRLDRGEAGARVELGPGAAAELRVEAIRSAMEGGALGIDGDALVLRIKRAQALGAYSIGRVRLDGAIGFVPDPWLETLEAGYTLKPLSRTASERLLGWPTSDLSALVRAALGPARLSVAVGNGEGLSFPERNDGKTTTAVLEVVPLHAHALRVAVAAVGRDGSLGVASIRDRRAGGGATLIAPRVRLGGEAMRAWGLGDRGEAAGWAFAGWADAELVPHVFAGARGATLGLDGGGRRSTFGGALAIEPWSRNSFRLWLAIDRATTSGAAMPLPGADAGDATLVMLIASAIAPFTID